MRIRRIPQHRSIYRKDRTRRFGHPSLIADNRKNHSGGQHGNQPSLLQGSGRERGCLHVSHVSIRGGDRVLLLLRRMQKGLRSQPTGMRERGIGRN